MWLGVLLYNVVDLRLILIIRVQYCVTLGVIIPMSKIRGIQGEWLQWIKVFFLVPCVVKWKGCSWVLFKSKLGISLVIDSPASHHLIIHDIIQSIIPILLLRPQVFLFSNQTHLLLLSFLFPSAMSKLIKLIKCSCYLDSLFYSWYWIEQLKNSIHL